MATMWITLRLPGSSTTEVIEVEADCTARDAVQKIAEKLALPSLGVDDVRFVIAPTSKKSGAIVDSSSTFRQLMFSPREVRTHSLSRV